SAALSILLPINLQQSYSPPSSPASLSSVDIQSDDENDHEVASKRLGVYSPVMPTTAGPVMRPQFSCPDFAMGTARGMKARLKETPPMPTLTTIHFDEKTLPSKTNTTDIPSEASPSPRSKIRKKNSFVAVETVKRGWEESFGQENVIPRKKNGLLSRRPYE